MAPGFFDRNAAITNNFKQPPPTHVQVIRIELGL